MLLLTFVLAILLALFWADGLIIVRAFPPAHPAGPAILQEIVRDLDADNVRYDAMFPDHPLSRVRGRLGALQASIYMDPAIAADAIFPPTSP